MGREQISTQKRYKKNIESQMDAFKKRLKIFLKKYDILFERTERINKKNPYIFFNIKFLNEKSDIIKEFNQLIEETYFENNELKKNSPVIILDNAIYIDNKSLEVTIDEIKFEKCSDENHEYNKYNNEIDKKITLIDSEPLYTIYIEKGYDDKLQAIENLMMRDSSKENSQYPSNEKIILYLTEIYNINLKKTLKD
jgi:hypothetical protein